MVSSAYQYYLTNYAYRQTGLYDTHKKSELREIYKNIIKQNKKSPLYRFNFTDEVQRFAIDLKENARSFRNIVLDATVEAESGTLLAQKAAFSSDENTVSVAYVGENPGLEKEGVAYEIGVKQLAQNQTNRGDFLSSNRLDFRVGSHSFDLTIGNSTYEFQFKISDNSTNLKVQEKLARLVNRSNVGLRADVLKDQNGSSALELTAIQSGILDQNRPLFYFSDSSEGAEASCIRTLGLNHVIEQPANASFTVNGEERISSSNTIILNGIYEVELKDVTKEEKTVQIGMQRSAEALLQHMKQLVNGFNSLYDLSKEGDCTSDRLHRDLNYITKRFRSTLDSTGLTVQKDGHLNADEEIIVQAASDGTLTSQLDQLSNFRKALMRQINQISIDPLEYIKRTMVTYPNPKRNYANAYQASVYSGLMFNGYI